MLNLHQYQRTSASLADHLPWAALVAPGIILNKDGSLQRTFRYYGPDLESATEDELVNTSARANNILNRFGSGWTLFFEARRMEAIAYPDTGAETGIARLIEAERRAAYLGQTRQNFETQYFFTLVYMPPPDAVTKATGVFLETGETSTDRNWHREVEAFASKTEEVLGMFASFMPFIEGLSDSETLTYLHAAISENKHKVLVPETPVYLDAILVDTPLLGGLAPRLGNQHLRTLTVLGFPNMTRPGLLDSLNHLDFSYRWVSRFIALDKDEATKTLTRVRRQWFNKRKSVNALLREILYAQTTQLTDSDADNQMLDADMALQALGASRVSFGYLTTTITVADADVRVADEQLQEVEQVVNGLGFVTIKETLNAVEAWLSSLPGHLYANVRQHLIHSLNLVHLMPLSAVWAGPVCNAHLDGPPILYAVSSGSTPFRLSTHVGDVGHMLVLGPTGAGKSVLLSFLALQFQRYPNAQVFIFDKGGSARAATLAMGGQHHVLGRKADLSFQPLREIDSLSERAWALEWLVLILSGDGLVMTPELKALLWSGLCNLATAPETQRTFTGLSALVASNTLGAALQPYTLEGPFGHSLDAEENGLDLFRFHCFETEDLMREQGLLLPVLTYLFHRLDGHFDGSPALLILDEAWIFLDNPLFAAQIREWLKVLRKKNVSVIFATQSLSDIINSAIAPAIIESCPQRLFLPNARATEPQSRDAYERMGLNDRQIALIAQAIPKRQYYLQSRHGNRLFELGLGAVAMAVCGASSPEDHALMDRLTTEVRPQNFASALMKRKGLGWAAGLLDTGRGRQASSARPKDPLPLNPWQKDASSHDK